MSQGGTLDSSTINPQVATQFDTDSGTAIPIANIIEIFGAGGATTSGSGNTVTITAGGGGSGIETIDGDSGSATGSTIKLSGSLSGSVGADTGATVRFVASASQVVLSLSDSSTGNTLIGNECGNPATPGTGNVGLGSAVLNHTTDTSNGNTAIGNQSMFALTDGVSNTSVGASSLVICTTGGNNTSIGFASLNKLVSGVANIAIGHLAGTNYTSNESGNIIISNGGVIGDTSVIRIGTFQASCFIAGIAGVSVSNLNVVTIDTSTGQLGSQAAGASLIGVTETSSPFNTTLGSIPSQPFGQARAVVMGYGATGGTNGDTVTIGYDSIGGASENVVIGSSSQTSGNWNVILGAGSGSAGISQENNIVIGVATMINAGSATQNVIIGGTAGSAYTAAESNNIVIGFGVTGTSGESNALHIGDTGTDPITTAFIGGIAGVTVSNTEMVTIDTTTRQLGSQPVPSSSPSTYFQAFNNAALSNITGDGTQYNIVFDTTTTNVGAAYATGTGMFTAPTTGSYYVGYLLNIFSALITGQTSAVINWLKNGSAINLGVSNINPLVITDSGQWTMTNTSLITLTAGDTLQLTIRISGGAANITILSDGTPTSYIFGSSIGP